jgi:hypothetical protein
MCSDTLLRTRKQQRIVVSHLASRKRGPAYNTYDVRNVPGHRSSARGGETRRNHLNTSGILYNTNDFRPFKKQHSRENVFPGNNSKLDHNVVHPSAVASPEDAAVVCFRRSDDYYNVIAFVRRKTRQGRGLSVLPRRRRSRFACICLQYKHHHRTQIARRYASRQHCSGPLRSRPPALYGYIAYTIYCTPQCTTIIKCIIYYYINRQLRSHHAIL